MANPRSSIIASTSQLSLTSSDDTTTPTTITKNRFERNGSLTPSTGALYPNTLNRSTGIKPGKYSISSMITDPKAPVSLLPSLTSFSTNAYVPSSLSSLGTTFTPSSLPISSSSNNSTGNNNNKSVAQRRSQAPNIIISESRKVEKKEFENYLESIGTEWERWEKERRLGREGRADLGTGGVRVNVSLGSGERKSGRRSSRAVGLGIIGGKSLDESYGVTQEEDEEEAEEFYKSKRNEEILPPLSGVPSIFFDPEFNLTNPRTFDLVTERIRLTSTGEDHLTPSTSSISTTKIGTGPITLTDLATDQILQEKLSHYTAVIESHLVKEIGLRSSSFFSALSNLQSLHTQGEVCLEKISELQLALSSSSSSSTSSIEGGKGESSGIGTSAKRGLEILRSQARRRGLEKIEEGVRAVEEVWNALEGIRELVEQGEWMAALEVGESVEERYYGIEMIDVDDKGEELSLHSSSSSSSTNSGNGERLGDLKEEDEDEEEGDETFGTQTLSTPTTTTIELSPLTPTIKSRTPRAPRKSLKLNLTKVKALNSVPTKLSHLKTQVAKALESELVSVLDHELILGIAEFIASAKDFNGSNWKGKGKEIVVASSKSPNVTSRAEGTFAGGEEIVASRFKERVRPVVRNLVRANGVDGAISAWRESTLKEVRAMVRQHLPTGETSNVEDDEAFAQINTRTDISEKSQSLARKLRSLSHLEFLLLAQETYSSLLACIEIVELHAQVLIQMTAEAREEEKVRKSRRKLVEGTQDSSSTPKGTQTKIPGISNSHRPALSLIIDAITSGEDTSLPSDISDVVHATAELANLRFSKVIGVRTEVHSSLSLEEFVEIFDASWNFVLRCEVICQRMIVGLRGVMVGQAKAFLQSYHQKRISESAKLVENEQWGAAEVTSTTQNVVNLILQSAVEDPAELLIGSRKKIVKNGEAKELEEVKANTKQLDIEGREYFAVSAGLASLEILSDYLKVVMNCPLLTTDAVSKVVEYMKSFNSRTCQVVLGAGAMRSAGLKNITAKHLALASQALSIMISLIPYIRETLRRHLNPKQAVMLTEFDKLKRDYQEHQNEIHSKLVAIMGDRLMLHCKTLEAIDWEQPIPGRKEGQPNIYMEALVKEHTTLHKVLSRFLQGPTVEFIMMQVFSALNAGLAEQYGALNIKSEGARRRMMADVTYLKTKLAELKGMERATPGAELENLISMKQIPEALRVRPQPQPRTASFSAPFSTTPSPLPSPPISSITSPNPLAVVESTSRPSTPLPALPIEAPVDPILEVVSPIPLATPPKPVARRSMAERLGEIARRGSGDFPSRTPSPVVPVNSKLSEVVEGATKSNELPSIPMEREESKEGKEVVNIPEESKILEKESQVVEEPEEMEGSEVQLKETEQKQSIIHETPTISISTPEEVQLEKVDPAKLHEGNEEHADSVKEVVKECKEELKVETEQEIKEGGVKEEPKVADQVEVLEEEPEVEEEVGSFL